MKKNLFVIIIFILSITNANAGFIIGMGTTLAGSGSYENETTLNNGTTTTNNHDIKEEGYYVKIGGKKNKFQHSLILQGYEITSETGNIDISNYNIKDVDFNSVGYELQYEFLNSRITPIIKLGFDLQWHDIDKPSKFIDDNDYRFGFGVNAGIAIQSKLTDSLYLDAGINYKYVTMQEVDYIGSSIDNVSSSYDLKYINLGLTFIF